MTREIYLTIILFCLVLSAKSQVFVGVKRGVTLSQVTFKDLDPNFNPTIPQGQPIGVVMGGIIKVMQEKHTGLQFDINLVDKGWSQLVSPEEEFTTRLRYWSAAAQTHISLGGGRFRVYLLGGPYLGYLMQKEESEVSEEFLESIRYVYDENDDNPWDFGIAGGGGFSLDTSLGLFHLESKINLGLSNIIDRKLDTEPRFSRHLNVEVSIAYLYPILKFSKESQND